MPPEIKSRNNENLQRINLCSSKQLHTADDADVTGVGANGLNIAKYTLKNKNVQNGWRHVRNAMRAQPICKVHFTKITKFAFFLITIRYISQKCIIFASNFKNGYKISKNF